LAFKGVAPPDVRVACELGFGQGVSLNIHAAAPTVDWWGTDFNPQQVANAQRLSQAAGSRAQLCDDSFAEFCQRDDLPSFDFIGVHGIWSWV
jgi:tRNA G46 methylase TrmB